MTERYYSKDYDELYYIFDSHTVSEEAVDERIEYDGYNAFEDSLTDKEILKLLNENDDLKKENWILLHFFEQVYYDYLIRCGADDDKELMEMSNAFQSKDLREILRYCIGETDKEKLKYYSKLYKVDLE